LFLALSICVALGLAALSWGLPSYERNALVFGARTESLAIPALSADDYRRLWTKYPNYLPSGPARTGEHPRSAFNPVRTFHPDEYVILKGLARMRPAELDMYQGFFGWPALQFYVVGAGLQAAKMMGLVHLVRDISFYFIHPEEMAKMYIAGRLVTLLMSMAAVVAIWGAAAKMFGPWCAGLSALFLAAAPLFSVNSHYMTADAPMLLWVALALWIASHMLLSERRRWYTLGGIAVGLAASTRYQGALAGLIIFAAHLFRGPAPHQDSQGRHAPPPHPLIHLIADSRLLLSGMVAIFTFLLINNRILALPAEFISEITQEFRSARSPDTTPWPSLLRFALYGLGPALAVAALFGLIAAAVRGRKPGWLLIWGFLPAAVFLCVSSPFMVRYWMPILPLPIIAAAWAVCALGRFGLKTSGLRKTLAFAIGAAVLLTTLAQSAAMAVMHSRPDPRLVSGRWIAANVPQSSTIAILSDSTLPSGAAPAADPWQFLTPPISPLHYRLLSLNMDLNQLDALAPDYVVISDFQLPPLACRSPLTACECAFMDRLQDTAFYEPYRFRNFPDLLNRRFVWPWIAPPHDFRYADPGVTIYMRVKAQ